MSLYKHLLGSAEALRNENLKSNLMSLVAEGHNIIWDRRGLGSVMHLGLVNQTGNAGTLIAPRVLVGSLRTPPKDSGRLYTPWHHAEPGNGEPYEIAERFEPAGDIQVCLLKSGMERQGTPYPVLEQFTGPLSVVAMNASQQAFFGIGNSEFAGQFRLTEVDVEPDLPDLGYPMFAISFSGKAYTPVLIGCRNKIFEAPALGTHKEAIISRCEKWGVMPPKFISSLTDLGIEDDDGNTKTEWFAKEGDTATINANKLYDSEGVKTIRFEYHDNR